MSGKSSIDGDTYGCRFLPGGVELALLSSPPCSLIQREISDPGSPSPAVSTSPRQFLVGGIVLDCSALGGSAPCCSIFTSVRILTSLCPRTLCWRLRGRLGWPRRLATLRPRRQYIGTAPFGLGGALSFGFAGGTPVPPHQLGYPTPFVRAIDASWHAPTSIILMDRAMHHGGPDDACVDILAWPWRQAALRPRRRYTGVVPFGLGGAPSCGFDGGTPVSPHELGYATPFVRANDVPL